jgi:hypothetical protein
MLNGAPPKHDDMQAVAFVPEMSHFHAQMGASSRTNSPAALNGAPLKPNANAGM